MRFFYYDGKAIQGPLEVSELLKQPGFASESVVCPAGSQRSEDWKPAVNYDELREALLKPKPEASPMKCPVCGHPNPGGAVFCNGCGARMDGKAGGPRSGGMGRLSQTTPSSVIADLVTKPPSGGSQLGRPESGSPAQRSSLRRLLLSAAAACVLVGGAASGYLLYKKRARHPVVPVVPAAPAPSVDTPPPSTPVPSPEAAPRKRGRRKAPSAEPAAPAPTPRPKRVRRAPGLMDVPPKDAGSAPAEVALPGIPKKVRPKHAPKAAQAAPEEDMPAPEPGRPSGAPPTSESLMIESALEQFSFCHQLMRQGEFGDVFESCLCPAAREGSPYKGRKGVFVEQSAEDPQTEAGSSMEVIGSKFVDGAVLITGRWTLAEGSVVERMERWVMEENRWCLAP